MLREGASLGTASQQAYYVILQFMGFFAKRQPLPLVTDFYTYEAHSGTYLL